MIRTGFVGLQYANGANRFASVAPSAENVVESRPVSAEPKAAPSRSKFHQWVFGDKPVWRQLIGMTAKTLTGASLLWGSVWTGAYTYDKQIGDGPPPKIQSIVGTDLQRQVLGNSTEHVFWAVQMDTQHLSSGQYWKMLAQTRHLLSKVAPEVGVWFEKMYADGKLDFAEKPTNNFNPIAKFDILDRKFTMNNGFFSETDGGRVSIIVHEYWHSRQNWGKFVHSTISPGHLFSVFNEQRCACSGQHIKPEDRAYQSIIEDEAHSLEYQASKAMGMDIIPEYFTDAGRLPTELK